MAYSYVVYDGNGSQTDFNVTFDFLSRSHVHALLDGVETTAFTWVSDTLIRFTSAPPVGTGTVKLMRQTPIDARLVDFVNGSTLNADTDLDQDSDQLFYLIQETVEGTVSATVSDDTNLAMVTDEFSAGTNFTPGSTTTLELSAAPGSEDNTIISFDGVLQHKSTYSISGTTVTFSSPIPLGVSSVDAVQFPTREFFYATLADNSVTSTKIAGANVTEAKIADNAVTANKIANGEVTLAKLASDATAGYCPIGCVMDYAGAIAPTGWQLCEGTALSRTTYAALFAIISTTYGVGNGTTTFNVPDLRGATTIGAGTGTYAGATARTRAATVIGAETVTLDTTMIPAHTHTNTAYAATSMQGGGAPATTNGGCFQDNTHTTGSTGGGLAHQNMQPSVVMNKIIRIS